MLRENLGPVWDGYCRMLLSMLLRSPWYYLGVSTQTYQTDTISPKWMCFSWPLSTTHVSITKLKL